jgi:hypothetical protein
MATIDHEKALPTQVFTLSMAIRSPCMQPPSLLILLLLDF